MKTSCRFLRTAFVVVFSLFVSDLAAQSIDEDENVVNFAYAVVFGTGVYQVNDQTAFIFRVPFAYRLREPSTERPGLKLLLPALAGYYDYDWDNIIEGELPGDAATFSFVPGLELEYVMSERWRLKPYGQFGFGRDIENDENAWIYVAGLKSRYRIPHEGRFRFALGNIGVYTGYDPDNGNSQSLGALGVGIDAVYPWDLSVFGKRTNLANHLIYYWYLDNPGFEQGDGQTEGVSGEIEWGLALGFEKPPKIFAYELKRIGLGFRFGDDIKGIRFVTDFPF